MASTAATSNRSSPLRPPAQVHLACGLLVLALLTGVVEAFAWVRPAGLADVAESAPELVPRLVLYLAVFVVLTQFRAGRNWARWVLLIGIGVVGTASLVIEPVTWLMSGPDVGAAWRAMDAYDVVAALSRAVHVAAVLVFVALGMHSATGRYCREVSAGSREA